MKKSGLVLTLAGVLFVALTSCNKPAQTVVEKTITIQLNENQEYSFVLPESIQRDAYAFLQQASHYNISMIDKNASGEQFYHYLPALDYRGNDQVILSDAPDPSTNAQGEPQCGFGMGQGNGPCGDKPQDDHHRITINFVIGAANAGTETASR